jgi:pimeloyl-ACP methyl ester carboxylesterase
VVYLPGLDGTGRLLHRQHELHAHYDVRCVAYPHDRPQTYESLAEMAVPHLEPAGGVVLAESFGGAVALTLALKRPDLVRRLLLINTFAYFPRRLIIRLANWAGYFFPTWPSPPFFRGARGVFFFGPDIKPPDRHQWWLRTADVPMRGFALRLTLIAKLDLRARLSEIGVPALVLAAPNDRVVPPSAGHELARLLPRARLVQPCVGHAAMIHPTINVARLLADPAHWPE